MTTIAETCARRGIERVVHCHADHWEPEEVAKRLGPSADVARWLERCRPAVPTLFVKPPLGFHLDDTSPTGVTLLPNRSADIEADFLRTLVAGGVGVGVHIHHEAWTQNTLTKLSPSQRELHDLALRQASSTMDSARMRMMIAATLEWLRSVTSMALDEWHFVHGCWAFGASDPEICQLEDELPLLYSLGCRGDFSFPAGRRHCDPPWARPKWVVPAVGRRACELDAADASDFPDASRMLVWASCVGDWWCGVDTYSEESLRRAEAPNKIERYLARCPLVGGTAYVKTHSHGMHPHYWPTADNPQPTLGAFAHELEAACSTAAVPVSFLTTDEVARDFTSSCRAALESSVRARRMRDRVRFRRANR